MAIKQIKGIETHEKLLDDTGKLKGNFRIYNCHFSQI